MRTSSERTTRPDLPRTGVDLHHEIHGRADSRDPAVVLLHGLGSRAADWRPQVAVFGEHHRVVTVDLRGHGRSPAGRWLFTIDAMAEDVERTLARVGQTAVHVVGLSLGGAVGLALALRAPGQVRSLTLANAFARLRPGDLGGALRGLERVVWLCVAPMSLVAARVASGLFPRPEQEQAYRAAVDSLRRTPRAVYLATLRALLRFDARRDLGAIQCPTLIVVGDRDRTVRLAAGELLWRAIPGATLLVVPDSGHATPYDQPDIFNHAVLDFIAAVG